MIGILQIKGVIKFIYTNKNECMTYLNHCDKTNLVTREKCIVILPTTRNKKDLNKQSNFTSKGNRKGAKSQKLVKERT